MTSPSASRRKHFTPSLLGLLLVGLGGCAAPSHQPPPQAKARIALEQQHQQALALRGRLSAQNRLARVALPLQAAAAELCPKPPQAALGIRLANRFFFDDNFRDTAIRELGLGDVLQVTEVLPGSPAQAAGIAAGDYLVRLDGNDFPIGEGAPRRLRPLLESIKPGTPVSLELVRDQQPRSIDLTPLAVCRYPLLLMQSDEINAYATHRSIQVTRGMLSFASDDWDLAFVIAHELAHNLLGHIPATVVNGSAAGLLDLWLLANGIPSPGLFALGGSRVHAKGFETEADYVALYLMARAGLSLEKDADYWRRVAALRPTTINTDSGTHPDNGRRYLAMQRTLEEIRAKQAAGSPLIPDL